MEAVFCDGFVAQRFMVALVRHPGFKSHSCFHFSPFFKIQDPHSMHIPGKPLKTSDTPVDLIVIKLPIYYYYKCMSSRHSMKAMLGCYNNMYSCYNH